MNTISSILQFIANLMVTPTLSSTGISAYSSRVKNISGGQFKIGKWRYIQLRMTANQTFGIYGYNTVITGFDAPSGNYASLSASIAGYDSSSPISAYINSSGYVVMTNGGREIQENWIIVISGWYIANS